MKIAILGAQGFLGKSLSSALLNLGHEVIGFVLEPSKLANSNFPCRLVNELIYTSQSNNFEFDVTINLAARRSTLSQPLSELQVTEYTFHIPREFIHKTASQNTLVINASTYIQNYAGIKGKTVDSYGKAKQLLSNFIEDRSKIMGFRALDLYFFTLYGIGDRPSHLVPLLLNAARTGQEIELSPGDQLLNLMYVEDAVSNILKCLSWKIESQYEAYSVWAEDYFSVRQLVSRIEGTINLDVKSKWGARSYVGHEMMTPWNVPVPQLPFLSVPTTLEEGIKKIWQSSAGIP